MVPWDMLPKDLQKAILAMVVLYGGTMACTPPMVCDPPPPPSTSPRLTPTPSKTPMVCDPPPPPRTATPVKTPMICDPPPPPTRAATPPPFKTPMICDPAPYPSIVPGVPARHFQVHSVQTTSDPSVSGAKVQGKVVSQQGNPLGGLKVSAEGKSRVQVVTGSNGEFVLYLTEPGDYRIMVESGLQHALNLKLGQHDVVTVEWVEVKDTSQAPLPLAEIRTVDIVWNDSLTFGAETPWPEARYRWSVSGGTLIETEQGVTWQPPAEPGRYLLQVVADWGPTGLAVDALTLIVEQDGSVTGG
jgi:hypothetical protein